MNHDNAPPAPPEAPPTGPVLSAEEFALRLYDCDLLHSVGQQMMDSHEALRDALAQRDARIAELERDMNHLRKLLDTPEVDSFDKGVPLEAAHQVKRWSVEHDAGKAPQDWFWLVGYLAGKALQSHIAGDIDKAKHRVIATAAALRNWHAHIRTGESAMRPGIAEPIDAAMKEPK